MEFEWDEKKRTANIQKHKIDFIGIESVFENLRYTILNDRLDYGEARFVTVGIMENRIVTVVYTETENTIRIISIRKATKNEQQKYFEEIAD